MFQEEVHQHRDLTLKMKKKILIHVHKRTPPIQKNYIILGIQKKSLINRVRLSFKILKHKYWIIKKNETIRHTKRRKKNTKQTKLFKSIFLFRTKDSSVLSVLLPLPSWFECMP